MVTKEQLKACWPFLKAFGERIDRGEHENEEECAADALLTLRAIIETAERIAVTNDVCQVRTIDQTRG